MWALRENQHWQQTADFVSTHLKEGEHVFAPPDFSEEFLGITTARSSVTPDDVARLDWAVVHKGRTASLSSELFDRVAAELPLVYANPVFLVFSRRAGLQKLNFPSPHLHSWSSACARPAGLSSDGWRRPSVPTSRDSSHKFWRS